MSVKSTQTPTVSRFFTKFVNNFGHTCSPKLVYVHQTNSNNKNEIHTMEDRMKKIIAIVAVLASTVAVAGYGKTKVVTSVHPLAMATGLVSYDQLCLEGNTLQTIEPKEVCVAYKTVGSRDNERRVCVETEMQILSRDLDYTKTVCVKRHNRTDRCLREEKVAARLATSYNVSTYLYKWYGSHADGEFRKFKTLNKEVVEVPACN